MPNLLPVVVTTAASKGQDLSFSQAKKIARRLEKRFDSYSVIDPEAYVLHFWDETGEMAVKNVLNQNAVRRIREKVTA